MRKESFIRRTYQKLKHSKRSDQFVILVSFLVAFLTARTFANHNIFFTVSTDQGTLHIHHLVFGIASILISGYIGLSFWHQHRIRLLMSVLFGVGSALTIDEFALWLYLKDVYWQAQGRVSIDAIIIIALIFSISFLISEAHDHAWIKRIFGK